MDNTAGAPTVKYCFHCGRRVSREGDRCWYCDASIRRVLRAPRRCQFCGEVVQREAVKCPHCSEFLDGRPRGAETPAHVVFIVDRSLLQSGHDRQLLAGRPVPPEVARVLNPQTLRAIEENQPALLLQPGVRALPAPSLPGAAGLIDIEAEPAGPQTRQLTDSRAERLPTRAAAPGDAAESALPARRQDAPPPAPGGWGGALGAWLARKLKPDDEAPEAEEEPAAQAEDKFRICESCGTEILSSDNYCFHCGVQYRKPQVERTRHPPRTIGSSNTGLHFIVLVLLGALAALRLGYLPWNVPYLAEGLASAAALFCVAAFFNRRRFFAQAVSLALLAATGFIYLFLR